MPVYEYQCKACHKEFEYQQRMSDPEKTTCEACGGALERVISRTAFQLKGSGWGKDLYASQKPAAAAGAGGEEKKETTISADSIKATEGTPRDAGASAGTGTGTGAGTGTGTGTGSGSGSGSGSSKAAAEAS
jgi:putative FmdB family regulatory protein